MTSNTCGRSGLLAIAAGSLAAALALCVASTPSSAEGQISVYGGMNTNFDSKGTLHIGTYSETRTYEWEGKSFQMPPYWGVQATWWFNRGASWGLAVDYTHSKAYANVDFATDPVYSHLEFTDGNNLVIANLMYRFKPWMDGRLVPFVGIGGGVAIPHVEVITKGPPGPAAASHTWEYQCCGPAAQVLGGLEYKLNDSWSVFTEAKLSYSHLDTDLNGGGSFKTQLWTPQLAVGLTYRFGN
jgi:lipid A oxidase